MSNFRPLQIENIPEGSEHGSLAESETTEVAARPDANIVMSGGTTQYFDTVVSSSILEQFRAIGKNLGRSQKAPSSISDGAIQRKIQVGEKTIRQQSIRIDKQ